MKWWSNVSGSRKRTYVLSLFFLILLLGFIGGFIGWYLHGRLINKPFESGFLKKLEQFVKEEEPELSIALTFYTSLALIITFVRWNRREMILWLHSKQKQRVRLLTRFASEALVYDHKSIYDSVIKLLGRCRDEIQSTENQPDIHIQMLLCSPLVDYPSRDKTDKWGEEFKSVLHQIITTNNKNVKIDIHFLSEKEYAGICPLNSFTEVLANYIANGADNLTRKGLYEALIHKTRNFIHLLESLARHNERLSVNRVEIVDVPCQIFLYKSGNSMSEVIVSFAGKKQLESGQEFAQGIHSVDEDIADSFGDILKSYISNKRIAIQPFHTLKVIDQHTDAHKINNYLKANINIEIPERMFSPAYANSSKFTSYVLQNIITNKKTKIMEIGAGSGVQSLVAYKRLQELGSKLPTVLALEPFDDAYKSLVNNVRRNNCLNSSNTPGIRCMQAYLGCQISAHKFAIAHDCKEDQAKNAVLYNQDSKCLSREKLGLTVDLLIADLPFVNSKVSEKSKDNLHYAFFDAEHTAHQCLFSLFKKSDIFAADARLVTSFSSLGGNEDILEFNRLISDKGLVVIQKFDFYEDGYMWFVYIIMKGEAIKKDHWINTLHCHPS